MSKQPKIFIFGMDGATSAIIDTMLAKGKLGNIKGLIERGTYGLLQSTQPPLSPTAWTSFMTGVDPSRHGIYDFLKSRFEDYKVEFFNSTYIQAESFWKIAGQEGKKSIVIDVPMTFPPEEINGIIIAGDLSAPRRPGTYTFPHDIQEELERNMGGYSFGGTLGTDISSQPDKYIKMCKSEIQNRFETAKYLMSNYDWDLSVLVITATDKIQHSFWKYIDKNHPQYSSKEAEKYSQTIFDVYEQADEILGKIISLMRQDVTTIIVSDHGFGPLYKTFRLNEWLARYDYLKKHRGYHKKIKRSINRDRFKRIVNHLSGLCKLSSLRKFKEMKSSMSSLDLMPEVNWNKTRAYSAGASGNIYINLKGRQQSGIVEPGSEYESLRNKLIHSLINIVDPETGQKIFQNVQKREDVYSGPFLQDIPDILLSWTSGYYHIGESDIYQLNSKTNINDLFATDNKRKWSGNHIPEGIFVINGQGIKKKCLFNGATITDIAPTVLHLLGLKVPEYMDGRVLTELMDGNFLQANPVRFDHDQSAISAVEKEEGYSQEEARIIQERLKDLGYME
jgi:predicted AlkP superfamily phosphohydrolase/phosphomutase